MKWVAALALCAAAQAQFRDLAATDDGSQVYFATSLRLASEASQNLPDTPAIYRIANGVILRVTTPPPEIDPGPFHLYSDGNPQVSGDGNVFSYSLYDTCYGGSACITFPSTSTSFLTVNGQPYGQTLKGEAQVSRNGRFELNALLVSTVAIPIPIRVIELRDLQTGQTLQPPMPPAGPRQALTSDGRVLGLDTQSHALTLWSPQTTAAIATAEPPQSAITDNSAGWVVYEAPANSQIHLRGVNVTTGQDVLLATRSTDSWYATPYEESLSGDGATVLYLAETQSGQPVQAWTVRPDGTALSRLTNFPAGVDAAVISGDGQTAVAVTGGRMVAIDIATGAVRELIGVTPTCSPGISANLAPGSLFPLQGTALAASMAVAPATLETKLAGVQVLMDGTPLPLLSVSPTLIWFQVPFEAVPGSTVTLSLNSGSPFSGCSVQVPMTGRGPYFFTGGDGNTILIHQGFTGLVTTQSPAQAGEVITAYALGLGGVTPQPATGVPTPAGPLFPLNWPFGCYVGDQYGSGSPLDVLFAGLAPTMIGIYQVNVRLPDPLPAGNLLGFNCGTPGNIYERGGGSVPIAAANQASVAGSRSLLKFP